MTTENTRNAVLYIDDEKRNLEWIDNALKPETIDDWNAKNKGSLSDAQLAALKSVELTTVFNNPSKDELKVKNIHPESGAQIEGLNTPMSKAVKDVMMENTRW